MKKYVHMFDMRWNLDMEIWTTVKLEISRSFQSVRHKFLAVSASYFSLDINWIASELDNLYSLLRKT
jgi:hypothetical protein